MPSADMLTAAAAAARDLRRDEEEELAAGGGDGDEFVVGPIPPEMLMEAEAVPQNEREAEVREGY